MHQSMILSACFFIFASSPQQALAQFRYQPEKVEVGAVYHYLKTNIDGTAPENVSIYVVSPDSVVALKFHPGAKQAGLVGARLDWKLFCATRLSSWQLFHTGERRLFATLQYLPAEKSALVEIVTAGLQPPREELVPHGPQRHGAEARREHQEPQVERDLLVDARRFRLGRRARLGHGCAHE
ncbi:MAG: hypothetical protein AAB354_07885 [candidate division KSB1 bacterium]